MAESDEKKAPPAVEAPKKSTPGLVAILVPGLIAGAAAFGGAKFSSAHAAPAAQPAERLVVVAPPPGPTVPLEPFLLLTPDATRKMHPMKVSLAVEFEATAKEESLKSFIPRIRDATLSYLRLLSYEDVLDSSKSEKVRADLLERYKNAGAIGASRVLITDLVVQ